METTPQPQSPAAGEVQPRGTWQLAVAGLLVFYLYYLCWRTQGGAEGLWLPGLGLGIALVSWFGWRLIPVLAAVLFTARWWAITLETDRSAVDAILLALVETTLHVLLTIASWWAYFSLARGSRWLDDPRSATLFLLIVPGGLSALFALLQALYVTAAESAPLPLWVLAAQFWLSRMVGILVVAPLLIATLTPALMRWRLVALDLPPSFFGEREAAVSRFGDRVELVGLTFASSVLALLLLWGYKEKNATHWMLWAACLVLIVWTCIRQSVRGGCFAASVTSALMLAAAQLLDIPAEEKIAFQTGIQGHLLAFCSSGLLVGVSATWIRANEMRYRHVVSRIPFVVYSARLPHGIAPLVGPTKEALRKDSKLDFHIGPSIGKIADVMLVSPAAKRVLGQEPEALIGPFSDWLERIEPGDRELVVAALAQLCLQRQPVTCEFRLRVASENAAGPNPGPVSTLRWLRDTLTPHYSEEGLVDGWEGLLEDITDQRALSQNLRKLTNMLQVLITNLPTGVYFVQAPAGFPILVNARARQLLGQREDLSAGVAQLSRVFRLHRPDGSDYPADDLPVLRALRDGVTCRANDIVVHRADGRKIPLITWAAPIDMHNTGAPDAAVWVLEDWTTMQQAEQALRESELRLRAVIETMDEGVIVQDDAGGIIDCNAAAATILGSPREQLIRRRGLAPTTGCVREDGSPFPSDEHPDRQALRDHQPTRGVIIGIPTEANGALRWLLVNSLPLPVGPAAGLNYQKARVVTTFADITQQLQAQESLRLTRDKYQSLVETLPFMLLQRDKDFAITYLNPAATELTGHSREEMLRPDFCESIIHPDDLPAFHAAAATIAGGESARIEDRFRAKDGSMKSVLGFFHPNFSHGQVVGSTSLIVDITMQRRLEEELQHAKHLELVGRLASGTVHDFNNLLTVLMGMAGLAKTEVDEAHPVWQYLTRIEDVGEQAAHLTGQLLTFSKQRPRRTRAVDLNAVVTQTLKLAKSVLPGAITVQMILDPAVPPAQGDEVPFKQIVMNLCLNARDAMPEGGTLTVRTDLSAPPTNHDGKAWVHLSIQDTGHGMPDDVRERIFEPFFSTKERGTGLGLAVVQQIVKEFGGKVEVWSEPGVGTRFDIWLVRVPASTPVT